MSSIAQGIGVSIVVALLLIVVFVVRGRAGESEQRKPDEGLIISQKADDGTNVPPNVAAALGKVAAAKSKALASATVKVHHAYQYSGPTELQLITTAKTIAVDAEFAGYTDRFKIWDLDIVEGQTNENFGSDPDVAFLDKQGQFATFDGKKVDFTKPIRLLLIYAVPKTTTSVKLSYWGRDLTPKPIQLDADGMTLPKRK